MRWIHGFINTGTLYLPRPDGRGKYFILDILMKLDVIYIYYTLRFYFSLFVFVSAAGQYFSILTGQYFSLLYDFR
jgi:hypothetical protein